MTDRRLYLENVIELNSIRLVQMVPLFLLYIKLST